MDWSKGMWKKSPFGINGLNVCNLQRQEKDKDTGIFYFKLNIHITIQHKPSVTFILTIIITCM